MKHGQEVMKWNSASHEKELKWRSSEWNQSPQKVSSTKSATHEADVNFDVWYPRCSCVIALHGVKMWIHSITSQFSSYIQDWLTMLETHIQNQLKIPPAYAIKVNSRAHSTDTVKCVLWHWGVGSVTTPSLFSWPQFMWLQSDSQNWRSTIKPWLKTHTVCLPTSGSCIHPHPSDGNIYEYKPCSFKCIYIPISCVSTFPPPPPSQPTPSCHNLQRTYPCMYACIRTFCPVCSALRTRKSYYFASNRHPLSCAFLYTVAKQWNKFSISGCALLGQQQKTATFNCTRWTDRYHSQKILNGQMNFHENCFNIELQWSKATPSLYILLSHHQTNIVNT